MDKTFTPNVPHSEVPLHLPRFCPLVLTPPEVISVVSIIILYIPVFILVVMMSHKAFLQKMGSHTDSLSIRNNRLFNARYLVFIFSTTQ